MKINQSSFTHIAENAASGQIAGSQVSCLERVHLVAARTQEECQKLGLYITQLQVLPAWYEKESWQLVLHSIQILNITQ